MVVQPFERVLVLGSDRRHVDQHSLDEIDAVVLVEHAHLDHPVDVLDREAMDGRCDRGHAPSLPPASVRMSLRRRSSAQRLDAYEVVDDREVGDIGGQQRDVVDVGSGGDREIDRAAARLATALGDRGG